MVTHLEATPVKTPRISAEMVAAGFSRSSALKEVAPDDAIDAPHCERLSV